MLFARRIINARFSNQAPSSNQSPASNLKSGSSEGFANTRLNKETPPPFLDSDAAKWTPTPYLDANRERPVAKDIIVTLSSLIFMIYFFILREENDVDLKLTRTLSETLHDVEVTKLNEEYRTKISKNLPVDGVKERLRELGHPV